MKFKLERYKQPLLILLSFLFIMNFSLNAYSVKRYSNPTDKLNKILNTSSEKQDYIKRSNFIYKVSKIADVDIDYTKDGDVSINFKDVDKNAKFSKAFLDAQFLGFIQSKDNLIKPNEYINYKEARKLTYLYYTYNVKNFSESTFFSGIDKEFKKKFKTINVNFINSTQADFIFEYLKIKLNNSKKNQIKYIFSGQVNGTAKKYGDILLVTLDSNEKHLKGYDIESIGYAYVKSTKYDIIVVSYKFIKNSKGLTHTRSSIVLDGKKFKKNMKVVAFEQK